MRPERTVLCFLAALVGSMCLISCDRRGGAGGYTSDLRNLASSVGPVRPSPGRITGGFEYARWQVSASRTAAKAGEAPPWLLPRGRGSLVSGERIRLHAASARPTPEALAADGLRQLIGGRPDPAITRLQDALSNAPAGDGRFDADLAAALLTRGERLGDPADFARALEHAERSIESHAVPAEAHFTRAVALEMFGLYREATEEWEVYLSLDADSPWGAEAGERLAALRSRTVPRPDTSAREELLLAVSASDADAVRRIVANHRQEARELAEEELLTNWAERRASGDRGGADLALAAAREIGEVLASFGGDTMLRDAVAVIDSVSMRPSGRYLELLVEGHRAFGSGLASYSRYDGSQATIRFERASRYLGEARSPFAGWADLHLAICAYQRSEYRSVLQALLKRRVEGSRYHALEGRIQWIIGLTLTSLGRFSDARAAYQEAEASFEEAGERGNTVMIYGLQGEVLAALGDQRAAWTKYVTALRNLDAVSRPRRRHAILDLAADELDRQGLFRASLLLRHRVVLLQKTGGNATDIAHAHVKRSRTLFSLGRIETAWRDLDTAERWLPRITDDEIRDLVATDLWIARARFEAENDPGMAIQRLGRAIAYFHKRDKAFSLTQLYFARAVLHRRAGSAGRAEADLWAAINTLEYQRGEIHDPLARGTYFVRHAAVFSELIDLLSVRPERASDALGVAERLRSRAFLDLVLRPSGAVPNLGAVPAQTPLTAEEIRAALPSDLAVIEYAVMEHATVAWLIQSTGVLMWRWERPRRELDELADRVVEQIRSTTDSGIPESARRLAQEIVQPLLHRLRGRGRLVFVPDGPLLDVPFAALEGSEPGRYLVEEGSVGLAPSASSLVATRAASSVSPIPALMVANPWTEEGLPSLPAAEAEAVEISALYPGSVLAGPKRATREFFLAHAHLAAVIHFSGHAESLAGDPLGSSLRLTPEGPDDDGRLTARQVLDLSLPHTDLVVLSACGTGRSSASVGSGVFTLGSAFLATGVSATVASLWPVEDQPTDRLLVAFHRRFQSSGARDPLDALRCAQLGLLRSSEARLRAPGSWSGFVVLVGVLPAATGPEGGHP